MCDRIKKDNNAGKGAGKKGPNGAAPWCRGDEWTIYKMIMEEGTGGKKGSKVQQHLIGTVTKDKGCFENKRKGKGKGKSETIYCYDCGEQEHIGVNSLF